jgi:serralysin
MADVKGTPGKDIYKVKPGDFYYGLDGDDEISIESSGIAEGGKGNDIISVLADVPVQAAIICYWSAIDPILVDLEAGFAYDGLGTKDKLINVHNVHGFKQDGDKGYGSRFDDNFFLSPWTFDKGLIFIDGREGYDNIEIGVERSRNQGELVIEVSVDMRKVIAYFTNYPAFIFEFRNIESFSTWDPAVGKRTYYDLASLIDNSKFGSEVLLRDFKGWQTDVYGTPVSITFSFLSNPPTSGGEGGTGFSSFTSQQKDAVRSIFSLLQQQTKLTFIEADEGSAQIRFGVNQQANTRGYSFIPDEYKGDARAGDVWIDKESAEQMLIGQEGYYVLIHEIAHALGLQHPLAEFDKSGETVLLNSFATLSNTVMLDVNAETVAGSWPTWFGNYDIQALRYLYGFKAYSAGNNKYIMSDAISGLIIIDDGGLDTIDASTLSSSAFIDLREGSLSSIGIARTGISEFKNVSISIGSHIENAIGSRNDDVIIGNSLNNLITFIGGNDIVDGKSGIDSIDLQFNSNEFNLTNNIATGYWNLEASNNFNGSIELRNMERLLFKDKCWALDLNESGNAGTTAKILGAVFGKESVSNKSYVGIGLSFLDSGWTYDNLAGLALDAAGAKTNDQIVSLLWTNVIGTKPTAADKQPFIALLENGMSAGALAHLAADTSFNTTNINLVGLAQTGIEYIPL